MRWGRGRVAGSVGAAVCCALVAALLPAAPVHAAGGDVQAYRHWGPERVATSVAASAAGWAAADHVVVATASDFPDALSGTSLATALGAPLLLSARDRLPSAVADEIQRLGSERAMLLGGEQALSAGVADDLAGLGVQVTRLAGPDRFATAAAVAREVGVGPSGRVTIALGAHADPTRAWPDALSAGGWGTADDPVPVLLTGGEQLPAATLQALDVLAPQEVLVLGGTAAVSEAVEVELNQAGYGTTRLAGPDRYATSVTSAEAVLLATPSMATDAAFPLVIASGAAFPDGLSAGALAARLGGLLLLVPPQRLADSPATVEFVCSLAGRVDQLHTVGGTAALSDQVMNAVQVLLEQCEDPADPPPVDEPPVDEPPVDEPPVDEPPVDEPPVDEPPVDEPPEYGCLSPMPDPADNPTPVPQLDAPRLPTFGGAPSFSAQVAFLYEGADPVQSGVDPSALSDGHQAVLSGHVVDRDGAPVPGVVVRVVGRDEFGQTATRADGRYDLVVTGGQVLTLEATLDGVPPVQRRATPGWDDYHVLDDIVLTPRDAAVTAIDPSAGGVHVSRVCEDDDGPRATTVVVEAGTSAVMHLADGSTEPLDTMHLRATEFTVGDDGPQAMPGQLPPTSLYTYAMEISVDEAIEAGAQTVTFDQPVAVHIDDFLGFPVGIPAMFAYYDRAERVWMPMDNGVVVEVVEVADGLARLDLDGDGTADDAEVTALGISDTELAAIADRFAPGDRLARFTTDHLTAFDAFNYPCQTAPGGLWPSSCGRPKLSGGGGPPGGGEGDDHPCAKEGGSWILCEARGLGEEMVLSNEVTLAYDSTRAEGQATRSLHVPVSGPGLSFVQQVDVSVTVAGVTTTETFVRPIPSDAVMTYTWDGLDAFGREVEGPVRARIDRTVYWDVLYDVGPGFGEPPTSETSQPPAEDGQGMPPARQRNSETFTSTAWLGTLDSRNQGLGGWTLPQHHAYHPPTGRVFHGSGGSLVHTGGPTADAGPYGQIATIMQGSTNTAAPLVEGDIAYTADIRPWDGAVSHPLALGGDGSIYFIQRVVGSPTVHHLRRVAPDGRVYTVAGNGTFGHTGDGGPATEAAIGSIHAFALGPDGDLYFAESCHSCAQAPGYYLRRVSADGIIDTIAGQSGDIEFSGAGGLGDGGPAAAAAFEAIDRLAVADDGSVYLLERGDFYDRVRRIGPDGIITTYVGGGDQSCWPDDVDDDGVCGFRDEIEFDTLWDFALSPDGEVALINGSRRHGGASCNCLLIVGEDGRVRAPTDPEGTQLWQVLYDQAGDPLVLPVTERRGLHRVDLSGFPDAQLDLVSGPWVHPQAYIYNPTLTPSGCLVGLVFPSRGIGVAGPPGVDCGLPTLDLIGGVQERLPASHAAEVAHVVPSPQADEMWAFNSGGGHVATVDVRTGAPLWLFDYDDDGWLATATDVHGMSTTIQRDDDGAPTAIVDGWGRPHPITLDEEGWMASATGPAGTGWSVEHSAEGLLQEATDRAGATATYQWAFDDEVDEVWELTRVDARDGTVIQVFDDTDIDSPRIVRVVTDGLTDLYRVEQVPFGPLRRTHTDPAGRLITKDIHVNGLSTVAATGQPTAFVRTVGHPLFGDAAPYQSEVQRGTTTMSTQQVTAELVDPLDPLSFDTLTMTATERGGEVVVHYDAATRTETRTTADGTVRTTTYNPDGTLASVDPGDGLDTWTYTYDTHGLITAVSRGSDVFAYSYDDFGRLLSTTAPTGATTTYAYDDADHRTQATFPDGTTVTLAPDAEGRQTGWTMPSGATHQLHHTGFGQLAGYSPPVGQGTQATYTDDRNPDGVTFGDGTTLSHTYDAGYLVGVDGPRTSATFSHRHGGDAGYPWTSQTFTIDSRDIEVALSRDLVTGSCVNNCGLVTSVTQEITDADPFTYDYTYDQYHRLTKRVLSAEAGPVSSVDFGYDEGNLSTFGPFTIHHDAAGIPVALDDGTLQRSHDLDGAGRETGQHVHAAGVPVASVARTRDGDGRITDDTTTIATAVRSRSMTYDANGQLTSVAGTGGVPSETFTYDVNGNLTGQVRDGVETISIYDAADRIIQRGTVAYSYDDNGYITAIGDLDLDYLPGGRLAAATLPGGAEVSYDYDALGRLTLRTDADGTTRFIYGADAGQGLQPTAVRHPGGQVMEYLYDATGRLAAVLDGPNRYAVLTDAVGSPVAVVAGDGTVVLSRTYSAFGELVAEDGSFPLPIGFAGGIADPATGLVRLWARDYDPASGRWTAPDPLLLASGDANLYRYVANDPVGMADPSGTAAAGGSFFAGAGGSFSIAVDSGGISLTVGVGGGIESGLSIDPLGGRPPSGWHTEASAGVGPFSVGATSALDWNCPTKWEYDGLGTDIADILSGGVEGWRGIDGWRSLGSKVGGAAKGAAKSGLKASAGAHYSANRTWNVEWSDLATVGQYAAMQMGF